MPFIFLLYLIEIGNIFFVFLTPLAPLILDWSPHKISSCYLDNCTNSSSVPNWDRQRFLHLFELKILPWTSLRLVWLSYKQSRGYPKFYSLPQSLLQIHTTNLFFFTCDGLTYRAGDGHLKIVVILSSNCQGGFMT